MLEVLIVVTMKAAEDSSHLGSGVVSLGELFLFCKAETVQKEVLAHEDVDTAIL
jgi:hypothetical protein